MLRKNFVYFVDNGLGFLIFTKNLYFSNTASL